MKFPGITSGPNTSAIHPRMVAERPNVRKLPRISTLLLPVAIIFAMGSIVYTYRWNDERQKAGPCIDCARQKAMMDEVYSGKRIVQKGQRL